jgi:ribosome-associated protein
MPDDLISSAAVELGPGVRAGESGVRLQYARGGGPGGQNVNKLNTKAELWVALATLSGLDESARQRLAKLAGRRLTAAGEIHLSSDTHRTQQMNRAAVFDRLRELIVAAQHQPKRRRKTRPTRASKQRRLDAKKLRGNIKSGRRYTED